jgi:hypothetical protein
LRGHPIPETNRSQPLGFPLKIGAVSQGFAGEIVLTLRDQSVYANSVDIWFSLLMAVTVMGKERGFHAE